jgi:hypothetical protein
MDLINKNGQDLQPALKKPIDVEPATAARRFLKRSIKRYRRAILRTPWSFPEGAVANELREFHLLLAKVFDEKRSHKVKCDVLRNSIRMLLCLTDLECANPPRTSSN